MWQMWRFITENGEVDATDQISTTLVHNFVYCNFSRVWAETCILWHKWYINLTSFTTTICSTSNDNGLWIAADPFTNETLPVFTVRPAHTVAVLGRQALIECSGHAHPEPRLEWIPIHNTHFPREGHVLPTGALHFDPVATDDAGVYRCLLSNSAGRVHIDISVQVRGKSAAAGRGRGRGKGHRNMYI